MSDLQTRLERIQGHVRLPSIVAGVATAGTVSWVGGAGDVPGDPADTQYRIGSITKTLVAVLVMRARDEGLLSLDDPIGRFVPESGYAEATIGSLLAHSSGMQSEPVGPWWERSPGVAVDALLSANDGTGRVAGAGEYYHYSNLGFALLGEAVARLRGAAWWDVVTAELLEPLGMTRTSYLPVAPHAQGHSVVHFTGELADEPHQDTRRDGAGRPGLEHGHRPAPVGRLPGHRPPRRPGTDDPGRDGDGAAAGRGVRAGPAADRRRRPPPDRAHRLDAGLPGQPVRRPLDAGRLRRC